MYVAPLNFDLFFKKVILTHLKKIKSWQKLSEN